MKTRDRQSITFEGTGPGEIVIVRQKHKNSKEETKSFFLISDK